MKTMSKTLKEIADLVGGEIEGNADVRISGVAGISDACDGDIVFAETPRLFAEAQHSQATAIIAPQDTRDGNKPMIIVENPRYAFSKVIGAFSPVKPREPGIHPAAAIDPSARIGENPSIGHHVHIGKNSTVGDHAWIYPFTFIGDDVHIGDDCVIHPFVSIYDNVTLNNRVIVHSNTVIGSDGFGYTRVGDEHSKIPQIGTIIIGDDVEIGASVTIDRANTGMTRIGRGTKIDNLVHIAHNVTIGENCILVAQVGVAGSVDIGNRVVIAGQSGLKDHLTVGDDVIICARTGVVGDVESGSFLSGFPARPHKEQMRTYAAQQRLPALLKQVRDLERRIEELEGRSSE